MGTDPDLFVHPERISRELICPICTQVLENPVQTADEHLFCEDELLEWMSRSNEPTCPVTGNKLDPDGIRKPSRIVMNMLGELERYCDNRSEGCEWTGENEHLRNHAKGCTFRRREDMVNEIRRKDEKIETLRAKVEVLTKQVRKEKVRSEDLASELLMCNRKLKVYDAFFDESNGKERDEKRGSGGSKQPSSSSSSSSSSSGEGAGRDQSESALQKILKLRALQSFGGDEGKDNGV